jgi:hypothetical protein
MRFDFMNIAPLKRRVISWEIRQKLVRFVSFIEYHCALSGARDVSAFVVFYYHLRDVYFVNLIRESLY